MKLAFPEESNHIRRWLNDVVNSFIVLSSKDGISQHELQLGILRV